jgi:carboxyl-terminal processing protease
MTLEEFINHFRVTPKMLNDLLALGEESGINYVEAEFNKSKPLIINRVRAYIARSEWDNNGWYRIVNEYNEIYQTAMNHFNDAEHLVTAQILTDQ